jgi:TfoX/Sxy family transcriptional regulator of competence genes
VGSLRAPVGGLAHRSCLALGPLARGGARGSARSGTIAAVAYDEELADRIRELLGAEPGLTEKKMFGGLAFLIRGNMAVAASGQGGVLVRVDPAQSGRLVATTDARLMEMRGQRMKGWLRVDPDDVRAKRQLTKWVKLGATYARSLPAKR